MLLELHIRRFRPGKTPGTNVNFPDGVRYRFEPACDEDGKPVPNAPHTCEVTNPAHIKKLLQVREITLGGEPVEQPEEPPSATSGDLDNPAEPPDSFRSGENASLEQQMCETVSSMTVADATEALGSLSDAQLHILSNLEVSGQNRSTLLSAIAEEMADRTEAAEDAESESAEG